MLLKNDGLLPLDVDKLSSIAVIGPNADSQEVLKGNYNGTASEYVTILEGIHRICDGKAACSIPRAARSTATARRALRCRATAWARPSPWRGRRTSSCCAWALTPASRARRADASNEYGAGDKAHLNLPGLQQKLLEKVVAVGKPTILVLSSGSALAVNFAQAHCSAIVQNWYAGSYGGQAVAELLFGKFSPSGRLPVTFYKSLDDLPAFTDYAMEGRTYRYLHAEPLYPFGYGLSYAKFAFSDLTLSKTSLPAGEGLRATVTVKNESDIPAATPVEFYVRDEEASTRVPHFSSARLTAWSWRPASRAPSRWRSRRARCAW